MLLIKPLPESNSSVDCVFPREWGAGWISFGREVCSSKNAQLAKIPDDLVQRSSSDDSIFTNSTYKVDSVKHST